jgi:hypothetical protein
MLAQMVEATAALPDLEDDLELQARIARKALKTDFEGWVTYRQGDYIEGAARAKNIGGGEIALLLNRFIAPEETISLELDCLTYRGLPIRLTGLVESCALAKDRRGFVAVVRAYRGAAKVA